MVPKCKFPLQRTETKFCQCNGDLLCNDMPIFASKPVTLSKKNLLSHLYWGTQWTMEIS